MLLNCKNTATFLKFGYVALQRNVIKLSLKNTIR